MFETMLTIQRPRGTVLAQHVRVQVDQTSPKEKFEHMQAYAFSGADLFRIFTLGWYASSLIQRGDYLVDELVTDPVTNQVYVYRVTGRPKNYQYDHQEIYAEVIVGN